MPTTPSRRAGSGLASRARATWRPSTLSASTRSPLASGTHWAVSRTRWPLGMLEPAAREHLRRSAGRHAADERLAAVDAELVPVGRLPVGAGPSSRQSTTRSASPFATWTATETASPSGSACSSSSSGSDDRRVAAGDVAPLVARRPRSDSARLRRGTSRRGCRAGRRGRPPRLSRTAGALAGVVAAAAAGGERRPSPAGTSVVRRMCDSFRGDPKGLMRSGQADLDAAAADAAGRGQRAGVREQAAGDVQRAVLAPGRRR